MIWGEMVQIFARCSRQSGFGSIRRFPFMSARLFTAKALSRSALFASAAVILAVGPISAVRAQYIYDDGGDLSMRREARLTPQQQEELFRAKKSWKRQSYNRRVSILEKEKRCIEKASNPQSFSDCVQKKRESRRALRADYRAYINPVRRRVGLPPIEDKQSGGKKGDRKGRRA